MVKKLYVIALRRHGIPNITVTKLGDKVIAHNYGHSGSGWTLAPGAIAYVNELLQKSEYATDLKPDTPITIIGAGVMGYGVLMI